MTTSATTLNNISLALTSASTSFVLHGNNAISSSSSSTSSVISSDTTGDIAKQRFFEAAVIAIGIIGTFANGGVLLALLFGGKTIQLTKRSMNILLINQTVIDLYSCVILVVTYAVKMADIYHKGRLGYCLCMIVTGEMLLWFGLNSSMINLSVITLERYTKIVHHIWHNDCHFKTRLSKKNNITMKSYSVGLCFLYEIHFSLRSGSHQNTSGIKTTIVLVMIMR